MTEQIPAETQARWQAAMMGGIVDHHSGGKIAVPDHVAKETTWHYALNIYESDTALIDAVELARAPESSYPYIRPNRNSTWILFTDKAGALFDSWRAAATAAVEERIREWEKNDAE